MKKLIILLLLSMVKFNYSFGQSELTWVKIDSVYFKNYDRRHEILVIEYTFRYINDSNITILVGRGVGEFADTFICNSEINGRLLCNKVSFDWLVPMEIDSVNKNKPRIYLVCKKKRPKLAVCKFYYGVRFINSRFEKEKSLGYITLILSKDKIILFDTQGISIEIKNK